MCWIAKPFDFRCKFSAHQKQYTFSKHSNETRRICAALAAPDFANSGKHMCIFLVVVVAVVIVEDDAEDVPEDDARRRCQKTMPEDDAQDNARRRCRRR